MLAHELIADVRRAAALPDNGVVDGLARRLLPDDGRLALVGDADARDLSGKAALAQRLRRHHALRAPDLKRVMLDPAGLGVYLRKIVLRLGDDAARLVKDNGTGAGRPLIERQNIFFH